MSFYDSSFTLEQAKKHVATILVMYPGNVKDIIFNEILLSIITIN